jgi:hypothetical protein
MTRSAAISATATAISSAESTATAAEASTAAKAAAKATSCSKSATTTEAAAHRIVGEAVLAHFQQAPLPVIAVELLDGVARVVGRLEEDGPRAFGSTVRSGVDISANNAACTRC